MSIVRNQPTVGTTVLGDCPHFHGFHLQKHHHVMVRNHEKSPCLHQGKRKKNQFEVYPEYSPNKDLH